MEQIRAMLEKIAEDEILIGDIKRLIENGNIEGVIAALSEKGFVFAESEWQKYFEWSKSLAFSDKQKKELAPEELDGVVGGGLGTPYSPKIAPCWFHAGSEPEYRDDAMRKRCNQFACKALVIEDSLFYQCECWGKDKCVNGWHYANGCK